MASNKESNLVRIIGRLVDSQTMMNKLVHSLQLNFVELLGVNVVPPQRILPLHPGTLIVSSSRGVECKAVVVGRARHERLISRERNVRAGAVEARDHAALAVIELVVAMVGIQCDNLLPRKQVAHRQLDIGEPSIHGKAKEENGPSVLARHG